MKIRGIFKYFSRKRSHTNTLFRKLSYSQCGEDLILRFVFDNLLEISKPTYLDIGAHHPFHLNNTQLFYSTGSRGINIDANPKSIELFEKHRPNDTNVNIGVSDRFGTLDFYVHEHSALSTFDKAGSQLNGGHKSILEIEVVPIQDILDRYCSSTFPDLLSLDVEGLDLKIIQSIDFRNSFPKVICVETISKIGKNQWKRNAFIHNHLQNNGYYPHSDTGINSIFVKQEFMIHKVSW